MTPTEEAAAVRVRAAKSRIAAAEDELRASRDNLKFVLDDLWDGGDGLSYRALGELAGFGKQYVGDLIQSARSHKGEDATV